MVYASLNHHIIRISSIRRPDSTEEDKAYGPSGSFAFRSFDFVRNESNDFL